MSEDLKPAGTGAVDSPLHPAAPHNVSETATSDPTGRLAGGVAPAVNMPDGAMSTAAPGEAPEPLLQAEAGHPIVEDDAAEHPPVDERKAD
ncbi:hypothetical protein [Methylobacterium sp. 1030]|uniref:hypothetical protein n=1 Tax=Methylobacterium sp. 1030 TaxID=3156404 RepID=UPI003396401B